jgi:hypothetical protein
MIIKLINNLDIEYVFAHLWSQSKEEAAAQEITLEDMKKGYLAAVGKPWGFSFWDKDSGKCCAIGYLESVGMFKWRSHFTATDDFFTIWFSLTKFMRRLSDFVVKENDGQGSIEACTISTSDYNWFQVLGFELAETDGVIDKYEKKVR